MKKLLGVFLSLALVISIFAATPASADELSDAKAQLAAAQTQLGESSNAYSQTLYSIKLLSSQIAAIDPATTDPAQITALEGLKKSLEAAIIARDAALAVLQKNQSTVDALVVQVRILEAASQYGKNCPDSWGVTAPDFSVGLDQGNLVLPIKVLTQMAAEPRNIVVNAEVQYSIDGANWILNRQIPYANYVWGLNKGNPPISFRYNAYTLVQMPNAKFRVVTTMAKEGCSTLVSTTEPVVFKPAIVPTSKMSIDLIYATYLPGISNYQERDTLKGYVAKAITDFQTAFGTGVPFKLNDGYAGNSSIFIYPQTKNTCTGDVNYASPVIGQSCTIGIYWAYGSIWALVDTVSVLAKENPADKLNAAAKADLSLYYSYVINATKAISQVSQQISNFQSRLNQEQQSELGVSQSLISEIQGAIATAEKVATVYAAANAVGAKYSGAEYSQDIRNLVSTIRDYTMYKYPVDQMRNQLNSLLNQAINGVSQNSGAGATSYKDAVKILESWKSIFNNEVSQIKMYINALEGQKLVLTTKDLYDAERNRYSALYEKVTLTRSEYESRANTAVKMANNAKGTVDEPYFLKASATYRSVVGMMTNLISYYAMWDKSIETSYGKYQDSTLADDGTEEDPAGSVSAVRESSGRYLIRVKTNQESSDIVVRATKAGKKTIVFRATTNENGSISIRTSRVLSGWKISLIFEDEVLFTYKKVA